MPAPTSPQQATQQHSSAVSFARLKQSIRAAASRANSKQQQLAQSPPSSFHAGIPSSPTSPTRQSQDSRLSIDSSEPPTTPSRSNSRLAFNISIGNPFRRSSIDLVSGSRIREDKEAERRRKEEEKQRERQEKEKRVQQERERKARLAAEKKSRTPMISIPTPPTTRYLWKPQHHAAYQPPTLSKGSMSSPDLTMRLRSGTFFDWENEGVTVQQVTSQQLNGKDKAKDKEKVKVSSPMPIVPRQRLYSGPSTTPTTPQPATPLRIRTGAAVSSSHLPLASSPPKPSYVPSSRPLSPTRKLTPLSPSQNHVRSPPASPTPAPRIRTKEITKHPNSSSTSLTSSRPVPSSPTQSSPPSSPAKRDLIYAAAYALNDLLRLLPTPELRAEVEKRLRPLGRLKQDRSPSGALASEERERRVFLDCVKDGFLLCVFLNTLLPSDATPLSPSCPSPSSPFKMRNALSMGNITSFLSLLQNRFQEDDVHVPAFLIDDLTAPVGSQATVCPEGIERVAKCIVAMGKIAKNMERKREKGKEKEKKRDDDGLLYLHDVLSSASNLGGGHAYAQNGRLSTVKSEAEPSSSDTEVGLAPPIKLRSPPSPIVRKASGQKEKDRVSVSTNATTNTYLSSLFSGLPSPRQYSLDAEDESKFGTIKTVATEATSVDDGVSILGRRTSLQPRRVSVSSIAAPDLGRVTETEEDTDAKTIKGARRKPPPEPIAILPIPAQNEVEARAERIKMGKGRWPEDFEEVFGPSSPRFGSPPHSSDSPADKSTTVEPKRNSKNVDPELVKAILGPSVGVIPKDPASAPSSPRRQLRIRRSESGSAGSSPVQPVSSRRASPTSGGPTPAADSNRHAARPLSPSRSASAVPVSVPGNLSQPPSHPMNRMHSSPPQPIGPKTTTASKMPLSSSPPRIRPIPRNSISPTRQHGHIAPKVRPVSPSSVSSKEGAPVLRRTSLQAREDLRAKSRIEKRGSSSTPTNDSMDNLQEIMGDGPVPFPKRSSGEYRRTSGEQRRTSGELGRAHPPVSSSVFTVMPTLPSGDNLSTSVPGSTSMQEFSSRKPPSEIRPSMPRGRFQSELSVTSQGTISSRAGVKLRPSSLDEKGRGRTESMLNLGGQEVNDIVNIIREKRGDGSNLRDLLIVKEEGKLPMHFQLGNCIGRGQFGSVYRALNLNTGQTVAVKRIALTGLSNAEIVQLMNEVDLLKRLSHPSIVKYEGMARDADTLSIVLEYVENGSLLNTLKYFGRLKEDLVSSYVIKILEGLHYLHQSQVVHCDLKAANILTTKNGNVKLSDFGVSLNLRAMENIKSDVAGTPNWMAPEVIELKGASTASDIWSLGCTVVELFTGKPPYADINNGMTVLFRIVDDDMPPLPQGCSSSMRDFLVQCFQKDPTKRPSAEVLFEHEWLKKALGLNKDLRTQDSIPFLRRISQEITRVEFARPGLERESPSTDSPVPDDFFKVPQARKRLSSGVEQDDGFFNARQQHNFVRTSFSKAVTCRVCQQPVKSRAVLCQDCSLIAHSRCAPEAPATCDIRAQLLLYAHYTSHEHPPLSRAGTADPASNGSPPKPSEPPLSSSPSGAFKIFSRKKSKLSAGDTPESGTPPTPITGPAHREEEPNKRHILWGRGRTSDDRSRSRASLLSSTPNTSSLRSNNPKEKTDAPLTEASVPSALASSPSQELETPNSKKVAKGSDPRRLSKALSITSQTDDVLTDAPTGVSASPEDASYARRRKRLSKADSKTECVVQ